MSTERLQKQEWLETIALIQDYYKETNRDYTEKKAQLYCILGELYHDNELVHQGKELLDNLDLHHKMLTHKMIALQLNKNNQLKNKCLDHIKVILELMSEYLRFTKNQEYSEYVWSLLAILQSFIPLDLDDSYGTILELVKQLVQKLDRENQILMNYQYASQIINGRLKEATGKNFFELAEKMYDSDNTWTTDANNLPIIQIHLEQALKKKDTIKIIKLFNFFFNVRIHELGDEIFSVLDYLRSEQEDQIFLDYYRKIVDRFFEFQMDKSGLEGGKDLVLKPLALLYEHSQTWNVLPELDKIKEFYNHEPKSKDTFWDIRIELAKVAFGYQTMEQVYQQLQKMIEDYNTQVDLFFANITNTHDYENAFKQKGLDFLPYKFLKILQLRQKDTYHSFCTLIEQELLKTINRIVVLLTSGETYYEHSLAGRIDLADYFHTIFSRISLSAILRDQYQNETIPVEIVNFVTEIDKKNIIARVLEPFVFHREIQNQFLKFHQFKDVLALFHELQDDNTEENRKKEVVTELDKFFGKKSFSFSEETQELLERKGHLISKNFMLELQPEQQEQLFTMQLFYYYVFELIERKLLFKSTIAAILDVSKEFIPNYLKLEYSIAFAKAGYLELSEAYLELFLEKPAEIIWKKTLGYQNLSPTLNINIRLVLQRIETLLVFNNIEEGKEELETIFMSFKVKKDLYSLHILESILNVTMKLHNKESEHIVLEEYLHKKIKHLLEKNYDQFYIFEKYYFEKKPEGVIEENWNKIKNSYLVLYKEKLQNCLDNPFTVGNYRILVEILKELCYLNESENFLLILQKLESNLQFLAGKIFSGELQKQFQDNILDESIDDSEYILFEELVRKTKSKDPYNSKKGDENELTHWKVVELVDSMINICKLLKNEMKERYYKEKLHKILDFYQGESSVYKNRIAIGKIEEIENDQEILSMKEKVRAGLEIVKKAGSFENNQMMYLEIYLHKRIDEEIKNYKE